MIKPEDFQLLSVQVVAFTSNNNDFRSARVLSQLIPRFASRFDGEIESQTQSPQINFTDKTLRISPQVSMASEDKVWRLEINPSRSDSFWHRQQISDPVDLREICNKCLEPLLVYPARAGLQIGRLALVINRFSTIDTAATEIAERFCKNELVDEVSPLAPFRHSKKFELHNLKTYQSDVEEMTVNSWVRCRGGVKINELPAVAVEQDINTLSEEADTRALTEQQIIAFFEWARPEIEKILNLYFPKQS